MSDPRQSAVHGKTLCAALADATGLKKVRSVAMSAAYDGAVEWTVTFLPTVEQQRLLAEALAAQSTPSRCEQSMTTETLLPR